jgi:hypothetical protein
MFRNNSLSEKDKLSTLKIIKERDKVVHLVKKWVRGMNLKSLKNE